MGKVYLSALLFLCWDEGVEAVIANKVLDSVTGVTSDEDGDAIAAFANTVPGLHSVIEA